MRGERAVPRSVGWAPPTACVGRRHPTTAATCTQRDAPRRREWRATVQRGHRCCRGALGLGLGLANPNPNPNPNPNQATRSAKLEHVTGVDHAGRLDQIEKLLPNMGTRAEAEARYEKIESEARRQHELAEARHAEHTKSEEKLHGTADVRAEEAKKQAIKVEQWLERLEQTCWGKAEQTALDEKHRSMQGHLMAQADAAKKELDKLRQDAEARLDQAEAAAKTHDEALVVLTTEVHAKCSSEEVTLG